MKTSLKGKLSLLFVALAMLLAIPAVALADNLVNDVTVGGNDTITAGDSTTIGYKINANGGDGQQGCNASDGSPATVNLDVPSGVTASVTTLKFTQCGVFQDVTFSSNTAGNYDIGVSSINDSGTGSYSNKANWTLKVNASSSGGTPSPADTTAPVLSLPKDITAEATGPSGAAVSYSASANDDVDGSVNVDCTPASGSTFGLGETTVNCSAKDKAGNVAAGSFKVTVQDTTAPVISNIPNNISKTATSSSGATVNYESPTAADIVDGSVNVDCTPASGSTFGLGETTVNCSAKDKAGNVATGSFKVTVTYSASGFLQPINSDGSSVFKLGSTVPVKFQLTGDSAGIENAIANLKTAQVSNTVVGSEVEAVTSTAASTGSSFRYDATSNQYIYNWGTKGLSAGTYQLRIDLGDGVGTRTVQISLKK